MAIGIVPDNPNCKDCPSHDHYRDACTEFTMPCTIILADEDWDSIWKGYLKYIKTHINPMSFAEYINALVSVYPLRYLTIGQTEDFHALFCGKTGEISD